MADNDPDMIWSVDFLESRTPTAEVLLALSTNPANSSVQYLRPGAQEHPLMILHTTDDGHESAVEGPWMV